MKPNICLFTYLGTSMEQPAYHVTSPMLLTNTALGPAGYVAGAPI